MHLDYLISVQSCWCPESRQLSQSAAFVNTQIHGIARKQYPKKLDSMCFEFIV